MSAVPWSRCAGAIFGSRVTLVFPSEACVADNSDFHRGEQIKLDELLWPRCVSFISKDDRSRSSARSILSEILLGEKPFLVKWFLAGAGWGEPEIAVVKRIFLSTPMCIAATSLACTSPREPMLVIRIAATRAKCRMGYRTGWTRRGGNQILCFQGALCHGNTQYFIR
jgi:hypothetical protein